MERSTINHAKSGDTNPGGQPRSWLLKLYARALPSGREEKNSARNFCRLRRQTALWYTLDDDHGKEREVRNCPPKRVRSNKCPECTALLQSFKYRLYDLEMEFCPNQHGYWLDDNEDTRVLELMKTEEKDLQRKLLAEDKWTATLRHMHSRSFFSKLRDLFHD